MAYTEAANAVLAPVELQRLAGTGTAESSNAVALQAGIYATLKVGATAIRVTFTKAVGLATRVATTDLVIGAYERFDWVVREDTKVVYCEAADGLAAYEAWVWNSSTKV